MARRTPRVTCLLWLVLAAVACWMADVSIGHAAGVSPRQLLEVVDIGAPVVSPDGRRVSFRTEQASVERNIYDTAWYVQGLDDALPRRVADGGVPLRDSAGGSLTASAIWSADGRWIYYRAFIDDRVDVWRAAADGSGAQAVTHDAADVRDFALKPDGRSLRYSVGATRIAVRAAEQAEYDRGIRIDGNVPIGQGLFRSGSVEGRPTTERFGGVWFDRGPLLDDVPEQWVVVDLATSTARTLPASEGSALQTRAPDEAGVQGHPWKFARDSHNGNLAWLTRIGDRKGLMFPLGVQLSARLGGHAGRIVHCESPLCMGQAITGVQWRPGHDEVLFTVTDPYNGMGQTIFGWNVDTGSVRAVVRSDGLLAGGRDPSSDCGVSAQALVCVTADADRPPRLERIDLETGDRSVLFDPNAALAQDLVRDAPAHLLRWKDRKGRPFSGRFWPARGTKAGPAPLFVTYYSCPGFVRGGVGDEWPLASLAQAGIAALCINQPPGYLMDAVARHGQGTVAVASAVDLLAKQGAIDRTRVGMGGLSFGSAVTLWTATESHLLAAASVASPVVSPNYYLIGSMKGEMFLKGLRSMWGLGAPGETPARWKAISPAYKLDRIHVPILFQHSEEEYMYALDYEIPLLRAHRADLYVFPNEPHQKFQPRHKLAAYQRNLDWFRFWLQGYEDLDPTKHDRYARWRQIRTAMSAHPIH